MISTSLGSLLQLEGKILSSLLAKDVGAGLFSRTVSRKVFSPLQSLTSVFGMGTGGPSALKTPTMVHLQGFEPGTH